VYSEKTLQILRDNVRFEGRRINVGELTSVLAPYGNEFYLTGAAADLYQEFEYLGETPGQAFNRFFNSQAGQLVNPGLRPTAFISFFSSHAPFIIYQPNH
jgi:hypothetical protein